MKIVVNRCYGGFGLSDEAHEALGDEQWTREEMPNWLLFGERIRWKERWDSNRSAPELVEVVERLGREADGHYAALEVVEIPDGVYWRIDEYDGNESVTFSETPMETW